MKMATFTIKMANFTVNKYALAKTYSKAIAEVGQEFWNPRAIAALELLSVPESILLKLKVEDKRRANLVSWSTELVVEENRFGFRKTCGKNKVSMFWDQDENGSFPLAFNYKACARQEPASKEVFGAFFGSTCSLSFGRRSAFSSGS